MFFAINLLGILVFLALFSKKRKEIQWRCVGVLLLLNFFYRLVLDDLSHWPGNRIRCGGSLCLEERDVKEGIYIKK